MTAQALDEFVEQYMYDREAWEALPFVEQKQLFDEALGRVLAAEAAIKLISPEHITPQGARIVRLALGTGRSK